MRNACRVAFALGAVVLLSTPAWAQRPGGPGMFGGGGRLLGNAGVQKEIGLDAQQIEKANKFVEEFGAKQRERFQGLQDLSQDERQAKMQELMKTANEETQKAIKEILKPEQVKRFNQIEMQQRGLRAFMDPEVRTKMKLTEDQGQEIRSLGETLQSESRDIREKNQGDFQEIMKQMNALNKAKMEKVIALLTDDQKKTWKELTGEPFEVKFEPPRRPAGQ